MTSLPLTDFDFNIPSNLIAQEPSDKREKSKLLHYNQKEKKIEHKSFDEFADLIPENSIIVLNDTKVIKARVIAKRKTGAKIECFFLERIKKNLWKGLIKNSKRLKIGEKLIVNNQFIEIKDINHKYAMFIILGEHNDFEFLDQYGETPLPPYIKTKQPNKHENRYQTIFASSPGSVAAPTASLHFSEKTFAQLKAKNIDITYITLHIGLGTFNPIQSKNIYDHIMHKEKYIISKNTANILNHARKQNKNIFAIGTTVTRCLESNIQNNEFKFGSFDTNLFITPNYEFKCINGMLTNFHLPKSSLLILIASFIGKSTVLDIYNIAIKHRYRFFSFGDAMLIT